MNISKFTKVSLAALILAAPIATTQTASAQVFATDVIVQGSLCAGFDCVSGESFGFDTIRLKENNLRIHFQDTSASASFPAADWRLVANDSSNGGANYFAIEDTDAGTQPFRVAQGAGGNALIVASSGNVGMGTATPVVQLQVTDGNTPTLRLDQDGSSGFTPQIWDVAGNETNFFVRDASNSSNLVFRVRAGARANAIYVDTDGQVALGNQSPQAALHIEAAGGNAGIRLDNGPDEEWELVVRDVDGEFAINDSNTPGGDFIFKTADSTGNAPWEFVHRPDDGLGFNAAENTGAEMFLSRTGDLRVLGTITSGGPTCASGCDAVFDADYDLPTIEDHAEAMFANRHLPTVGPTSVDQPINLTEHMGNVLNELEKAHIFIAQLNEQNKALETRLAQVEKSLD